MVDLEKVKESDLWYIIGYIATDGHLSVDGRHINITSKDREHLYLIKNALFLDNKIGKKYRSDDKVKLYSQLQFGDVNLYRFLLNLGFTQQKSLNIGAINVNKKFFKDFLRGIIDGDGNISSWIHKTNYNRQWCLRIFSSSYSFIIWLKDMIKKEFMVEGKIHSTKAGNKNNIAYTLKFGKISAKILLNSIYYEGSLSLHRKLVQAKLCLQE